MPIDQEEVNAAKQSEKGKPKAIIYFQRDHEQIALQIANALRADRKIANLVYASNFLSEGDVEGCHAVVIQANAPKVNEIAEAYMKHMPHVERFFFDSEGNFVDGPTIEKKSAFSMPNLNQAASEDAAPPAEQEPEPDVEPEVTDQPEAESSEHNEAAADESADPEAEDVSGEEPESGSKKRGRSKKS